MAVWIPALMLSLKLLLVVLQTRGLLRLITWDISFFLGSEREEVPLQVPLSTHSDNVMWWKRSFVSFHDAWWIKISMWLFNYLWRHIWILAVSLSQTSFHNHSTLSKMSPGNVMTICQIHLKKAMTNEETLMTVWPIRKVGQHTHSLKRRQIQVGPLISSDWSGKI